MSAISDYLNVLPDGRRHMTIDDELGRCWTIITTPTAAGFRWTVYCHREAHAGFAKSLELMHPGGVAHGWCERDDFLDEHEKLLRAIMSLFPEATPVER